MAYNHIIKQYPKLAKKAKKMSLVDVSPSTIEHANFTQDVKCAFSMQCSYDPSLHDSFMFVVDSNTWYFDSGTMQSILPHIAIFSPLLSLPL